MFNIREVRVDTYRSGVGSNLVNQNDNAVKLTHIPTGITVSVGEFKTQYQNRKLAFEMLEEMLK
jgi:protein subunit release factor A